MQSTSHKQEKKTVCSKLATTKMSVLDNRKSMWKLKRIVTVTESCSEDIVDSHESDAYRQKKTFLHSPEFFSLYRRQVELSQKIYANSLYVIVAT